MQNESSDRNGPSRVPSKQTVLPRNCLWRYRTLDNVAIDFDPSLGEEAFQGLALGACVADRLGGFGLARDFTSSFSHG